MPGVAKAWNAFAVDAKIKELDERIARRRLKKETEELKKAKRVPGSTMSAQRIVGQLKGVNKTRRDIMRSLDE